MKKISFFFFILCLYIYIYNPIFRGLGISFLKIYIIFSFFYILLYKETKFYINKFKLEFVFLFVSIMITIIQVFIIGDGTGRMLTYRQCLWFLESFICPILFVKYIYQNKYDIFDMLIIIGAIAGIITFFLLLNPNLSYYIRSEVITDTLLETYPDRKRDYIFRSFGFAEILTSSYGIIQGIITVFCFERIKKSIRYLLPIPFLLISIIVNARTGLIPVLLGLPLFLLFLLKSKKVLFGVILISILSICVIMKYDLTEYQKTITWVFNFFKDTGNVLQGETTGNYSLLFSKRFIFFPDTIWGLLFGEGRSVNQIGIGKNSDIGFINQLFLGGIFYLMFIMLFLLYFCIRFYKISKNGVVSLIFFLTLIAANYKGVEVILPTGVFRLMSLCYVYFVFSGEKMIGEIHFNEEK